jgi:hypothetical protein
MIKKAICLFLIVCLSMWEGLFVAANLKAISLPAETIGQSVEMCFGTFAVCSFINSQIEKMMQGAAQTQPKKDNKKTSNSENDFKTIFITSLNNNELTRPAKVFQTFECQIPNPLIIKDLIVFYHCFLIIMILFLIMRSKFCSFLARGSIAPSLINILFAGTYAPSFRHTGMRVLFYE